MKVVENYILFSAVHSFDVEKFEFSVPREFVLMTWSVYKFFLSNFKTESCQNWPWLGLSKTDPTFSTE